MSSSLHTVQYNYDRHHEFYTNSSSKCGDLSFLSDLSFSLLSFILFDSFPADLFVYIFYSYKAGFANVNKILILHSILDTAFLLHMSRLSRMAAFLYFVIYHII